MTILSKKAISKTWSVTLIAILCVVVFAGVAYYMYSQPTTPTPEENIKVGAIYPLSGPVALEGAYFKDAWTFFINKINMEGGIKSMGGAEIDIFFTDCMGNVDIARSEAEKMVTERKVEVLVGSFWSTLTYVVQDVAEKYEVPHINAASSSPSLTARGFQYFFMIQLNDDKYAKGSMEFLVEELEKKNLSDKVHTAAILMPDGVWGEDLARACEKYVKEMTDWNVVQYIIYPANTMDLTAEFLKIKEADPDVLFLTGHAEAALVMIRTMDEMNYWPPITFAHDSGFNAASFLAEEIADKGIHIISRFPVLWDQPNPVLQEQIFEDFQKRYGYLSHITPFVQGAVEVLRDALEVAGEDTRDIPLREKIKDALHKIEVPGDRLALPYTSIKFDENGSDIGGAIVVGQRLPPLTRDLTSYRTIYPYAFATAETIIPDPRSRGLG